MILLNPGCRRRVGDRLELSDALLRSPWRDCRPTGSASTSGYICKRDFPLSSDRDCRISVVFPIAEGPGEGVLLSSWRAAVSLNALDNAQGESRREASTGLRLGEEDTGGVPFVGERFEGDPLMGVLRGLGRGKRRFSSSSMAVGGDTKLIGFSRALPFAVRLPHAWVGGGPAEERAYSASSTLTLCGNKGRGTVEGRSVSDMRRRRAAAFVKCSA